METLVHLPLPGAFAVSSLLRRNEDNPWWRGRIEGIKVRALNRWRHERRGWEGGRGFGEFSAKPLWIPGTRAVRIRTRQRNIPETASLTRTDTSTHWRHAAFLITLHHVPSTRVYEISGIPARVTHVRLLFFFFNMLMLLFRSRDFSTWIINRTLI